MSFPFGGKFYKINQELIDTIEPEELLSTKSLKDLINIICDNAKKEEFDEICSKFFAVAYSKADNAEVKSSLRIMEDRAKKALKRLEVFNTLSLDTKKLRPFATIDNFCKCLDGMDEFANVVYDEIKECLCYKLPDFDTQPLTDTDFAILRRIIEEDFKLKSKGDFDDACLHFTSTSNRYGRNRHYNPIKARIESVKWDGIPRIETFFETVVKGKEPEIYLRECSRLIFADLINLLYNSSNELKIDEIVILHGAQGIGKSTLCRMLALSPSYFTDTMPRLNSKAQMIGEAINGKLVVEWPEMSPCIGVDADTIKGLTTNMQLTYRSAYARNSRDHLRTCIYMGTSNKQYCLPEDLTGNRRYLPITLLSSAKDFFKDDEGKSVKAYILQCYAEALKRFNDGDPDMIHTNLNYKGDFELKRVIRQIQASSTPIGETEANIADLLSDYADDKKPATIAEIGIEALGIVKLTKYHRQTIKEVLLAHGWTQTNDRHRNREQRLMYSEGKLWAPPSVNVDDDGKIIQDDAEDELI